MNKVKRLTKGRTDEEVDALFLSTSAHFGTDSEKDVRPYSRFNFNKLLKAFQLYMAHANTNKEVANMCRITTRQLSKWITDNQWAEHRKNLEANILKQQEEITKHLMMSRKPKIIKKHLDITDGIDNEIMHIIEAGNLSTKQLSEITGALKNNADVSHKIVGIGQDDHSGMNVSVLIQPGLKGELIEHEPVTGERIIEVEASESPYYIAEHSTDDSPPQIDSF